MDDRTTTTHRKQIKRGKKNHIQNKQTIIGELKKIYKKIGDEWEKKEA
jgi:hypothetical protein